MGLLLILMCLYQTLQFVHLVHILSFLRFTPFKFQPGVPDLFGKAFVERFQQALNVSEAEIFQFVLFL